MSKFQKKIVQLDRREWLWLGAAGLAGCRRKVAVEQEPERKPAPAAKPEEATVSYQIELQEPKQRVNNKYPFRSNDRFRVVILPSFAAAVYLFNRGPAQKEYVRLFPSTAIQLQNPLAVKRETVIPDDVWMRFDKAAGIENFVAVLSSVPLPELTGGPDTIGEPQFEQTLAALEQKYHPAPVRETPEGDWTKASAAAKQPQVMVLRIPLSHS